MDNYGLKRGYPNNSGMLRMFSGKTDIGSKNNLFPTKGIAYPIYQEPMPYYKNDENKKFMLKYMNDGLQQKTKGVKRLTIPESVELRGGEVKKSDYNNI